jgi:hypothetical protein
VDDDIDPLVHANGIDATTGQYLLPPMAVAEVAAAARGAPVDHDLQAALAKFVHASQSHHMGLPYDVDPLNLSEAGWAIVIASEEAPAVRTALESLIAWRAAQVGNPARLKVFDHKTGESRQSWLARHGVAAGSIDPERVPYYLLVVGCPDRIPFSFCRELAVEYAVGMLSFDTAADYAAYAAGVIAVERLETAPRPRRVSYFAPRHAFDAATQLSADQLVKPLAEGKLSRRWQTESIWGERATHEAMTELLTRKASDAPGFLFTASHGMGFPLGHADQRTQQGALLCQDWSGPSAGAVSRSQYFTAADVTDSANVAGLFAFVFACFGGGTPARDRFTHKSGERPQALADVPFASALPKRLLAHPGGGALGCIAHVDRAWSHSIVQAGAGRQLIPFENAIGTVLSGKPIGLALKDFNERYAVLSTTLANTLEQIENDGLRVPDAQLATAWVQRNDAEGYVLFGDPAARLQLEAAGA